MFPQAELCNMVIECCSQERTFSKFYGLMGERFCKINQVWATAYEQCFLNYYATIHRYETNRLRNIARFFGHLMMTDGISWTVLDTVKMNEDDTTSSSRIFIKIMFQEMVEGMGLKTVVERFQDKALEPYLGNIFPLDNPRNTRFSINFFTSIGLGAITENMREHLKKMPALMLEQQRRAQLAGGAGGASPSDSDSSSSLSSSSLSESSDYSSDDSRYRRPIKRRDSRSRSRSYDSRDRSLSRSPPPRRNIKRRSSSYPRSPSPRRNRAPDSRSPPPRRRPSYSRSPSPPRRRRSPSPQQASGPPAPKRDFVHPDRARLAEQAGGPMNGGGGRDYRHPDRRADDTRGPPPHLAGRGGYGGGRGGYGGGGAAPARGASDSGWGGARR